MVLLRFVSEMGEMLTVGTILFRTRLVALKGCADNVETVHNG